MKTLTISQLSSFQSPLFIGYVDSPQVNTELDNRTIHITGWVVSHTSPISHISVRWKDIVLVTTPINVSRPDVPSFYPELANESMCGYSVILDVLGAALDFELTVYAELIDGSRLPLGVIAGHQQPLTPAFTPRSQPLMVYMCNGRSGSTRLMQILSKHPAVAVHPQYPHEMGVFRYWMHMLKVLSLPGDPVNSVTIDTFFSSVYSVGRNPYYLPSYSQDLKTGHVQQWLGQGYVSELAAFCQRSTEGFYDQVALSEGKPPSQYFAEKVWGETPLIPDLVRQLYPGAAEVFFVRDLRDVFCSVLAFNAKRGYQDFFYNLVANDTEYVTLLANNARHWLANWNARKDTSFFLRYEALILEPENTLQQLFDYLKLDSSPQVIRDLINQASIDNVEMARHRTSSDSLASIGRWKTDLSDDQKAICQEILPNILTALGYTI